MQNVITFLLVFIQFQSQVINTLCVLLFGKNYKPKGEKCVDKKYTKLSVDPLPIFGEPPVKRLWQYTVLLENYRREHGKELLPIKRRSDKTVTSEAVCPYCGAPSEYVYDNNGGRGEFWCKVCNSKFAIARKPRDDEPYCPFCHGKLTLAKKRKTFDIYRCNNTFCPYRKKKVSTMTKEQKVLFKKSPHLFKVRFIYRKFHFDFTPLSKLNEYVPTVDLPNITASPHVLGLILTYHIILISQKQVDN